MDNSTHSNSEILVQYLDEELSGTEKEKLEQQLASDQVLQEELNSLQQTREAVRWYGLRQTVQGVHQQVMEEMQAPVRSISPARRIIRYSLAVAASVVLIVLGVAGYNFYNLSSAKVFADNYYSYDQGIVRDGNASQTAAEKAYTQKQYAEVIRIHDAGEEVSQKTSFLTGIASLELNDNNKAIRCFNEVMGMNTQFPVPVLNDEAEYYLALSYIRVKVYDLALPLLKKIQADPGHTYHGKITRKLIRQVKMLRWR
jgi:tetratricopeptide (TPR) repeat protein